MKPILFDLPMPIITERLLLRPPQIGDGSKINQAIVESFEVLRQSMPWAKNLPSVDETEEFVRQAAANWILKKDKEPYLPLFIFDKNTNDCIGGTGFHHIKWEVPCLEIGYWVRQKYAGHGFITEAVAAITKYAFVELKVKRIEIRCDISNIRSIKVAKRVGYQQDAVLKSNKINHANGQVSDTLIFARYNSDGL